MTLFASFAKHQFLRMHSSSAERKLQYKLSMMVMCSKFSSSLIFTSFVNLKQNAFWYTYCTRTVCFALILCQVICIVCIQHKTGIISIITIRFGIVATLWLLAVEPIRIFNKWNFFIQLPPRSTIKLERENEGHLATDIFSLKFSVELWVDFFFCSSKEKKTEKIQTFFSFLFFLLSFSSHFYFSRRLPTNFVN